MPLAHRALAESRISEIEITESKRGSSYTKSSEIVRISKYAEPGDIIHEYSHAMEVGLDIYHDPEFIKIWKSGLENVTVNDIIYDEEIFETPIYRIINDKLVSDYQGRLYKEYGIFDGTKLNLEGMREYFSEGYTTYIMNPEKLKKHDPKLFRFIEEIGT